MIIFMNAVIVVDAHISLNMVKNAVLQNIVKKQANIIMS